MSLLSEFALQIVLMLLGLPLAVAFLYLANFQRTVLLVGRQLNAEDTVLLPDELRHAITPRRLRLYVAAAALALVVVVASGVLLSSPLILLIPLLLLLYGFSGPHPFRSTRCRHRHFVGEIALDLERKRRQANSAGDPSKAEWLAALEHQLHALRSSDGAIGKPAAKPP